MLGAEENLEKQYFQKVRRCFTHESRIYFNLKRKRTKNKSCLKFKVWWLQKKGENELKDTLEKISHKSKKIKRQDSRKDQET